MVLLENNVALEISQKICESIKKKMLGNSIKRGTIDEIVRKLFRDSVYDVLDQKGKGLFDVIDNAKKEGRSALILIIGFNGAGKTTTVAKLAKIICDRGYSCVLAAGDTFRSAAIQQLEEHGDNLGLKTIKHDYGADSAAVIFDGLKYANSKNVDVVLADTAGRNHQDSNLIKELSKIVRVNKPDLSLLVVESMVGNDVLEQAKKFSEVKLDGFILTKWDVDDKGGAALSLTGVVKKPILYLGFGQNYEDIKEFKVDEVVNNII
jgi:fused signal recognition particle receptor